MNTCISENVFVGYFGCTERSSHKIVSTQRDGLSLKQIDDSLKLLVKGQDCSTFSWEGGFVLTVGQILGGADDNSVSLDAEAVARLYQARGVEISGEFDGVFAIVLWDAGENKLYLWRDDSGGKLLYFYQNENNDLWFANNLKLLLSFTGKRPVSRLGLSEYLRFLDISPPYTMFEGVFSLEPEKYVCLGPGEMVACKSKPEPLEKTWGRLGSFDEVVSSFDVLLRKSIATRIESNPRTGAFLSGGIDSSLVCAVAADLRKDIKAVTVGFHDAQFDEAPVACNVAGHLGIEHEVLRFSLEDDLRALHLFTATVGSPFADPAIIPTFQCFEKTGVEFDLVLDGTGADTLIGMMPARHLRFILGYSAHLPTQMRKVIAGVLRLAGPAKRYGDLFDFDDPAELMIRWKGWSKAEITELCGYPCDLEHTLFYRIYRAGFSKNTPYELYSSLMGNLPDDRIHQSSAVFGPEVAFPFFDPIVRSFVRSLPHEYRYTPDEPKRLFRSLLGRYVPQAIWDVPKHGFDYPFEQLLRYRDDFLLGEYLSPEALAHHGFFNPAVVDSYLKQFRAGDLSLRFKIWALVMFQAWYRNFYLALSDEMAS
ncbi:asparagine synthetase B family protein [Geoalkalibacter halelectricus]|uniref:asparagine synthetase B family protein n=1 Tax=Geoalkalibacter halelectricus TaxID=2847045 RepID=UPI003D1EB9AD